MGLVLLAIPTLSMLFLQNRQVQTMITKYLAGELSEQLSGVVSISSVSYSFYKRIQVRDFYVEDQHGDTLIYSEITKVRIRKFRPERRGIEIRSITVENAQLNLVIDSSNVVNLAYITDRLKKPHVPPERKSRLHIGAIEMIDGRFSLTKKTGRQAVTEVDFNDLRLDQLQIRVEDLTSLRDTVSMRILSLAGVEKSGFIIGELSSLFSVGKDHLHFNDLEILTPDSRMQVPLLTFDFEHWRRFKRFSKEVDLNFRSDHSLLQLTDLAYFVPLSLGMFDRIELDGRVDGMLSNLKGDELFITFDEKSTLAFDFVMIGLPEINNTFIDFNFRELQTSVSAVQTFLGHINQASGQVPYPWRNMGSLDFQGKFTGYPDHFVANGFLATNMGDMIMDLSFRPDSVTGVDFEGRLYTRDFQLGRFLDQEEILSSLDMDVMTDGNLGGGQIRASLEGTVDTLDLYGYKYSNILLDGELTNKTFDGGFTISDPNIRMDFLGRMDFSGEVPEYVFTANVARARPYYLNLVPEEPNSFVSFLIETDLTGRTVDEMNGRIRLVNSLFEREGAQLQLYDVDLSTRNMPDTSWLQISSEMMDASIGGSYQLSALPASFKSMADRYLNLTPGIEPVPDSSVRLAYHFRFKQMNPVLDFFFPALRIGESGVVHGKFEPARDHFSASGFFPSLQIGTNAWNNVDLFSDAGSGEFNLHFQSDSMLLGENYSLVEHQFDIRAARDTAWLEMSWDNRIDPRYSGELRLNGSFVSDSQGERGFLMGVDHTQMLINSEPWDVGPAAVLVKKEYLKIDSLTVISTNKHLIADGVISARSDQDFNLTVKNLKLAELGNLTGINADLLGNITGRVNYRQQEGIPYIFSDLKVDTLTFNGQVLGPTNLTAVWNEAGNNIDMQVISQMEDFRAIEVDGSFTPGRNTLDFDVRMNDFELHSLAPYIGSVVKDLDGRSDLQLTVDGTLNEPRLNGEINLKQGSGTLSYLNTRYVINDRIRVFNNNLYLEDFTLEDQTGNLALVNGTVSHTYFRDFYLALNMEVDNLMLMNTRSTDNEVFYGTVFASGRATLTGQPSSISMNLSASTGANTAIYLPLYTAREVASTDFITFVKESEEKEQLAFQQQEEKIKGIEIEMDVAITPDATVQLIFDPQVGDIIETSGQGTLRMTLDPTSGFRILGDVELVRGDYLFTLQNVINKRFQIRPGGRIYFNGEPTDASIDLDAVYTTRTAPYNLYPGDPSEASESLKRRIPVECHLNLQGDLRSPTIHTGIEMPTADPETRNLLENSTSTEEETMRQFLSLLVINNFYSVSGYGAQDMGAMNSYIAGVTASELLSNQLSNWLSQISDDFDIGVNYRPGDEISSDEVEVALSTQLLDDRIIISGNVDVGGQQANPSSTTSSNPYIMGDFDVEFRLTDNVSVIAFNRARDELLYETAPYKQGVGVSYREEFDNLGQLLRRYREGLTNRKKKQINSEESGPFE